MLGDAALIVAAMALGFLLLCGPEKQCSNIKNSVLSSAILSAED